MLNDVRCWSQTERCYELVIGGDLHKGCVCQCSVNAKNDVVLQRIKLWSAREMKLL